jgi:hypothetical protein
MALSFAWPLTEDELLLTNALTSVIKASRTKRLWRITL